MITLWSQDSKNEEKFINKFFKWQLASNYWFQFLMDTLQSIIGAIKKVASFVLHTHYLLISYWMALLVKITNDSCWSTITKTSIQIIIILLTFWISHLLKKFLAHSALFWGYSHFVNYYSVKWTKVMEETNQQFCRWEFSSKNTPLFLSLSVINTWVAFQFELCS